jgi:hypothetical protein
VSTYSFSKGSAESQIFYLPKDKEGTEIQKQLVSTLAVSRSFWGIRQLFACKQNFEKLADPLLIRNLLAVPPSALSM